jgi:acyl carrier protein
MRHRCAFIFGFAFAVIGCTSNSEPTNPAANQTAADELNNAVRAVISEILKVDPSTIQMDKPISDPPLKADDLDLVEIVMELEDRLSIEISDAPSSGIPAPYPGKSSFKLLQINLVAIVRDAPKKKMNRSRPNH